MKGMIGAHKIHPILDLPRLREMIENDNNNARIANNFSTHEGKKVSDETVRKVRKGERWNPKNNSFVMKDQRGILPEVKTTLGNDIYETTCFHCVANAKEFYQLMHYKNGNLVPGVTLKVFYTIPSHDECLSFHTQTIWEEVGKVS